MRNDLKFSFFSPPSLSVMENTVRHGAESIYSRGTNTVNIHDMYYTGHQRLLEPLNMKLMKSQGSIDDVSD